MNNSADIRERVRRDYAVLASQPPGSAVGQPFQKGAAVKAAGYAGTDVAELPADTVTNAFGCGNPVAFSEVRAGDVVLDLGSGAGIDLLLAARRVGPRGRVIGVDMTDEMIEKAHHAISESGCTNVEVRKGYIESLPVPDDSIDWVLSNCVINLSPEKDRVFAEIARVLRPGGRMLVSDIVVEGLSEDQRRALGPISYCLARAVSEDAYHAGLASAGLIDVEVCDRNVYDKSVLADMARAERGMDDVSACGGAGKRATILSDPSIRDLMEGLAGKVQAIYIRARKPT